MEKMFMWTAVFVGGAIGSWIPTLWGAGALDFSSLVFGAFGSIAGIVFAFKITKR